MIFRLGMILAVTIYSANDGFAQEKTKPSPDISSPDVSSPVFSSKAPSTRVLTKDQWTQLDGSVERGLQWLATKQQGNGGFEAIPQGQPAITAFCLMAFLAQGESPADGQYRQSLSRAVEYIMAQQKDNGLIATIAPSGIPISRNVDHMRVGQTAVYNHAISALALAEVYGQCNADQAQLLAPVIEKAIAATLEMQKWGQKAAHDVGGWRYLDELDFIKSDLSITGWQLMFLRSAQNAGFDVPQESIEAAVKYIENCFLNDSDRKVHGYAVGRRSSITRAMAGAGVLAMAHAGKHDSKEALASGEWILQHDFSNYNADKPLYGSYWSPDRYHYGAVVCTQAMFQLGGKYWEQFFPTLVKAVLANQQPNGSWPPEKFDRVYGSCYSTSLCILSLSVPNQMLPIFQR
ncbi:hypothetical protein LF1_27770 [Rubripirellula obstinata]|uniref:Prenyltransferase and squalene oxidase repeat protein n=2 Tax=Rubripirellula obstinata TaxID=406547 RepID=A0A5B1CGC5_9BACT|nr:prenyltransferase/squalene oxidase repeat-containing protein [Rubripirellula obstinata]KAA1260238.1 hypothetical protein LF1_27770 [Rubripirellula obstinata]